MHSSWAHNMNIKRNTNVARVVSSSTSGAADIGSDPRPGPAAPPRHSSTSRTLSMGATSPMVLCACGMLLLLTLCLGAGTVVLLIHTGTLVVPNSADSPVPSHPPFPPPHSPQSADSSPSQPSDYDASPPSTAYHPAGTSQYALYAGSANVSFTNINTLDDGTLCMEYYYDNNTLVRGSFEMRCIFSRAVLDIQLVVMENRFLGSSGVSTLAPITNWASVDAEYSVSGGQVGVPSIDDTRGTYTWSVVHCDTTVPSVPHLTAVNDFFVLFYRFGPLENDRFQYQVVSVQNASPFTTAPNNLIVELESYDRFEPETWCSEPRHQLFTVPLVCRPDDAFFPLPAGMPQDASEQYAFTLGANITQTGETGVFTTVFDGGISSHRLAHASGSLQLTPVGQVGGMNFVRWRRRTVAFGVMLGNDVKLRRDEIHHEPPPYPYPFRDCILQPNISSFVR